MFGMSPFQVKCALLISLAAALAVFELVTRLSDRQKLKSGEVEDLRKDDTLLVKHNAVQHSKARFWTEGLLIIATGIALAVAMMSMIDYQDHGAFYDNSWRDPDVENHFYFSSKDNQTLEAIWAKDPENFDWNAYKVCLVRLGCDDCERVAETISNLASNGYVTVFSRSDLGKAYVERYGITYVPSVILSGNIIQLRSGDSTLPQDNDGIPEDYGQQTREIVNDLIKGGLGTDKDGNDPAAMDPNYTKYGTKVAIEAAMEEERLRQEQEQAEAQESSQENPPDPGSNNDD